MDGGGLGSRRDLLRSSLVVAEIALSLMLLVGAGLLIRSFVRLQNVSPGFNTDNVISMQIALTNTKFNKGPLVTQFYDELAEHVRHLPGVKNFGAVSALPLTSAVSWGGVQVEGYVPPPNAPEVQVDQRIVSIGYFPTMDVPIIKGRNFTDQDSADGQPVAIVDEKMANHFWPNADPIGKRVRPGGPNEPWLNIVGVTAIVKQYGLDLDTRMVLYYPHQQAPLRGMYVVARTATDPADATGGIVSEIHRLDPDAPVYNISTMDKRLHSSLARPRFLMSLLVAFAGFALVLASVGLYALLSYLVIQGTRDIGVRIALGAGQSDILRMIVRQGLVLTLIGVAFGLGGAYGLTWIMASVLYGIGSTDLVTFGSVAAVLTIVAFAACYIPARRASRVDPMIALRYE
jgi:predicted permease